MTGRTLVWYGGMTGTTQRQFNYKLPRILQWFTGNIGFHHIHHLSAKIPNYRLAWCYEEHPLFQDVSTSPLRTSLTAITAKLRDEEQKQMVGFKHLTTL